MAEWYPFACAFAVLLGAREASAQATSNAGSVGAPGATLSAGDAGVQRMRAGDCATAIEAFDAALRTSLDPQLYRDRGKCHEKLGHPFPAIDDYRAYLTGRPNAPDADAIRERVSALEAQVGVVRRGQAGVSGKSGAAGSTSIGGETDLGEPTGGSGGLETLERDEQLEAQADASPLRRGHGLIIGLAAGGRYFTNGAFGGAELGGLDLRYSFSAVSTILLELSVTQVNAGGTATALSGPGVLAGYEARIPFNVRVSDAFLVGATFRYEDLSESGGTVFAVFEPEGRVGYRHVFGPSFGLEAVLDGGVAIASLTGAGTTTTEGLIGSHVAVLLGF